MSNSVNLSLDVTKTGIQNPLIKVRQGDGGFETLHTTVTSNGEPFDLQGWTITFMGTTAGNHKIVDGNVKIVEAPNGIFDYTPSKAWGMDIGEFKIAYFKFVKGDGSASSANFRVNVIEAVDLTQEEAQNYISVVDATIAEAREHLESSLADVSSSVAATSVAASSVAVRVSSTASSAVSQVNSAASSTSSIASSAVAKVNGVAEQVNALSIGGRNLLLDTGRSFTGVGNNSTNGNFNAQGGMYLLDGGKQVSDLYKQYGSSGYLTLSFDWVASGDNISGRFSPQWNAQPWEGGLSVPVNPSNTNAYGHYEFTVPLKTSGYSSGWATGIQFRQDNLQGNITISNMKLEGGNIATDWTPAPEDAPSNDAQLVHKTGTETIAGDKTFSGSTTFSGGVTGGQINLPTSGDLNTLTNTGKYYQGVSANAANWSNRPSNAPNIAFSVNVIGQANGALATQVYYVHTTSRMWVRTMWLDGTVIAASPWAELANDNNVVHRTGNESISGDKTFTGAVNAAQKVYTRTIGSTNDLQIIYTRVGSVVTGRYTVAKSGVFTLSNNDGYKAPTAYPVNVIAQNINAWFTTDNRFSAPDGASQGNFMFITSDQLTAN